MIIFNKIISLSIDFRFNHKFQGLSNRKDISVGKSSLSAI